MDSKADGIGVLRPGPAEDTTFVEYVGEWWQGHKHGHGKAHFRDGRFYTGAWHRDVMQGRGRMQWADGTVFDGDFDRDEPHGWGALRVGSSHIDVYERLEDGLPSPVRRAARVVVGVLLFAALLFVLPHLVELSSLLFVSADASAWAEGAGQEEAAAPRRLHAAAAAVAGGRGGPLAWTRGPPAAAGGGARLARRRPAWSLRPQDRLVEEGEDANGTTAVVGLGEHRLSGVLRATFRPLVLLQEAAERAWGSDPASNSEDGWGNCWGLGWIRQRRSATDNSVTAAWAAAGDGWSDRSHVTMLSLASRLSGGSLRWGDAALAGSAVPSELGAAAAVAAVARCHCRLDPRGRAAATLLRAARRVWAAIAPLEALASAELPPPLPAALRLPTKAARAAANASRVAGAGRLAGRPAVDTAGIAAVLAALDAGRPHVSGALDGMAQVPSYWERTCGCGAEAAGGGRGNPSGGTSRPTTTPPASSDPAQGSAACEVGGPGAGAGQRCGWNTSRGLVPGLHPSVAALAAEAARSAAAVAMAAGAEAEEASAAGVVRRAASLAARPGQLIAPWSCMHAWAAAEQAAETSMMNSLTPAEVRLVGAVLGGSEGWLRRGSTDGQGVTLGSPGGGGGVWAAALALSDAVGEELVRGPAAGPSAVRDATSSAPRASDEATPLGAVLAVLLVYARVHLRRQVHYLRLGMMGLFTYTGDLEDAVAAVLWTSATSLLGTWPVANVLLALGGMCLPRAATLPEAPRERVRRQASAEHCAYLAAVVFGFCSAVAVGLGACIALPELVSEIVRVGVVRRIELRDPGSTTVARILMALRGE